MYLLQLLIGAEAEPVSRLTGFLETLIHSSSGGSLLFGTFNTWQNALTSAGDILVTAFVIYYILRLFSDSRAWQLLKGVLFILAFTFVFSLLNLSTISYVLSNSITTLVVSFVIIFQPELRTALESVGRNSLKLLSSIGPDSEYGEQSEAELVETLAVACEHMSETKTGALIVLERSTPLGDLLKNSPAAVVLNANLTSTALEQVFYKNSPLHDGALILRGGRIYAARCHVPLSDTYRLRKDMGTRHRAALGASEMGDTVAVVVSEERGSVSVSRGGRLYELANADALRSALPLLLREEGLNLLSGERLSKLDLPEREETSETRFSPVWRLLRLTANLHHSSAVREEHEALTPIQKQVRRRIWGLRILSLVLAFFLYLYVQTMTNPIETETFRGMAIHRYNSEALTERNMHLTLDQQTVDLTIRARRNTLVRIRNNPSWIESYIQIPKEALQPGKYSWRVQTVIQHLSSGQYEILVQDPLEIPVTLTQEADSANEYLPGVQESGSGGFVPGH